MFCGPKADLPSPPDPLAELYAVLRQVIVAMSAADTLWAIDQRALRTALRVLETTRLPAGRGEDIAESLHAALQVSLARTDAAGADGEGG